MTMRLQPLAVALALACGWASSPMAQTLCRPDNTTPFTASAVNAVNGFADTLTDSEGVSLVICTDSVDGQGNPPPCFFDPVIPGNAQSVASGFGGEGFWFLADNITTTTGAAAIDALVVMAAEAAYTTGVPAAGEQFPFTRLRVRIDVSQPGVYTVQYPWGQKQYTVNTIVDDRGRPIKREINDTTDIEFTPNGSRHGTVGPWLRWDTAVAPAAPAGYIGDGVTLHRVVGSPCGRNFVRISATTLDGITPLAIDPTDADRDGSTSAISNPLFTVMGKLAPQGVTPLTVTGAYYSRAAGQSISLFASAPTTATVTATPGGTLVGDGNGRFFTATAVATLPATVAFGATNAAQNNAPAPIQHVPVTDLVTITGASAVCSGTPRSCTLDVAAQSSDQSATNAPTLSLVLDNTEMPLANGALSVSGLVVLPPVVTIKSSAGGVGHKPLTVTHP